MVADCTEDMSKPDIRWRQRFLSYQKAISQLAKFIEKGELNELEEQGLIQAFEYTHELAWKLMKDYLEYQGNKDIFGSRDATHAFFSLGLIEDGDGWMAMIKDRNQTSHTYNEDTAASIAADIRECFFDLFVTFRERMQSIYNENNRS